MPDPASPVRGIRYRNPDWPGLRVEAVTFRTLGRREPEAHFRRPRRPDFHHLFLCTAGEGSHTVDFQRLDLAPRAVVHVAPGQVHAFGWGPDMDGIVLMFAPEALPPEPPGLAVRLPPCLRVEADDFPWVASAFGDLLAEYGRTDGGPVSARAMQHLLAALVLRLGRLAARREAGLPVSPVRAELFRLFEAEVERNFFRTRTVADYARRLGYAERTLARAVQEAGGISPKAYIDDRVLLEAKRLLVHTGLDAGRIAARLGFSEPTNFAKFFRKGTGLAPGTFRKREQAGA